MILSLLGTFTDGLSTWMTRIIVAVIIVLIGFIIGRMCKKLGYHALHELELNEMLHRATRLEIKGEEHLSNGLSYIISIFAIILALNQIGVTTTVVYVLISLLLVVLLMVSLMSIKDFIPNVFAGFKLSKKKLFKEGDHVTLGKIEGTVLQVSLVETRLKTKCGDLIVVPHQTVLKERIITH